MAISALLVVGGAVALAIGAFASTRERRRHLPGRPARSQGCTFDLADGDIVIVGGGRRDTVEVRRDGALLVRPPAADRARVDGRRVPRALALPGRRCSGPCRVGYRVVVPDNVALDIRTDAAAT